MVVGFGVVSLAADMDYEGARAAVLILAERLGKAIRSPAKSALLADAASRIALVTLIGVLARTRPPGRTLA